MQVRRQVPQLMSMYGGVLNKVLSTATFGLFNPLTDGSIFLGAGPPMESTEVREHHLFPLAV